LVQEKEMEDSRKRPREGWTRENRTIAATMTEQRTDVEMGEK
jgi:hypothetical protein